jgi:hypothetical protein
MDLVVFVHTAQSKRSYLNILRVWDRKIDIKIGIRIVYLDLILTIQDLHIPNFNFLIFCVCGMVHYLIFCFSCC